MSERTPKKSNRVRKPGPDPERLKLPHEDWEEAVREALEKERPEEEWLEEPAETEADKES